MDMIRNACYHTAVDLLHKGFHAAEVFAIGISVNSKLSEHNLTCMMVIGIDKQN